MYRDKIYQDETIDIVLLNAHEQIHDHLHDDDVHDHDYHVVFDLIYDLFHVDNHVRI
jgi:hypothetical protein